MAGLCGGWVYRCGFSEERVVTGWCLALYRLDDRVVTGALALVTRQPGLGHSIMLGFRSANQVPLCMVV